METGTHRCLSGGPVDLSSLSTVGTHEKNKRLMGEVEWGNVFGNVTVGESPSRIRTPT